MKKLILLVSLLASSVAMADAPQTRAELRQIRESRRHGKPTAKAKRVKAEQPKLTKNQIRRAVKAKAKAKAREEAKANARENARLKRLGLIP